MSSNVFVLLRDSEIPTRQQWESHLATLGFDLEFDDSFDPRAHPGGYVPVSLNGVIYDARFEINLDVTTNLDLNFSPPEHEGRDRVFSFTNLASLRGWIASQLAAVSLAWGVSGMYFDGQKFVSVDDALKDLRSNDLEELRLEVEYERRRLSRRCDGMKVPRVSMEPGSRFFHQSSRFEWRVEIVERCQGRWVYFGSNSWSLPSGTFSNGEVRSLVTPEQAITILEIMKADADEIPDPVERLERANLAFETGDPMKMARAFQVSATLERRGKGYFTDDKRVYPLLKSNLVEELAAVLGRLPEDIENALT